MYYTGTENECNDYLQTVNAGENYSGITSTWANVIEHPTENKCAIVKHENYSAQMTELESLTEDWYNLEII